MSNPTPTLKPIFRFNTLTFLTASILIAACSVKAHGKEFLQKEGDRDTIACITDDISMKNYRERCVNNFPELTGEIENAYRNWVNANAPRLQETSAACKERLSALDKDDPVRFNEIREYAQNAHAQFVARTGSNATDSAHAECKALIKELASPESAVPAYLADKIRNVTLKSDYDTSPLELGSSSLDLELRLVADKEASGTESLKPNFMFSPGENRNNIFVQPSSLIGKNAFTSFRINPTRYGETVLVSLAITREGAKRFKAAAHTHPGKRAALVLNKEVLYAANVREISLMEGKLVFISTPERAGYMKRQIKTALDR